MSDIERQTAKFKDDFDRVKNEIRKVIVGNEPIIDSVLICLLANGHALLEGVPGLGKTLLVRTLAQALHLKFSRIQFTPDLMPADITGTNLLLESAAGQKEFKFQPGPVFAHIVLADEINRATPKTQSAMLEAMQEHSVTVGGTMHTLVEPFFVLATQNPLEMEGTYPLPEAQLDRFLFKLLVPSPTFEDLSVIVDRTTGVPAPPITPVLDGETILQMRTLAREVPIAPTVREFAIKVVLGTHPDKPHAPDPVKRFVRYGSSPRGAQAVVVAAKIRALLEGRYNVAIEDIAQVALPALRHRLILNFEGQAEGIAPDTLVQAILDSTLAATDVKVGV
ncbi:MAG TPA: MoxR family ATPase [Chthonomonadaceae bacterium]|nr:MoxR family ATPase [Chthonomonadaceae bacterium]